MAKLLYNPVTGECRIKAEWGKGFTHDIWWDDTIGDFVIGPLRDDRGFITKDFERLRPWNTCNKHNNRV
jgi:hypothetical protein